MELLEEIKDKDLPDDKSALKIRQASRAVLFDENGLVPLLFVLKYNYHKLPGGGISEGEDKTKALAREVLEEVGSEIEVTGEVGKIVEYPSNPLTKSAVTFPPKVGLLHLALEVI